jgi:hypothetical protein
LDGEPGTEVLNLGMYGEKGKNADLDHEEQSDQPDQEVLNTNEKEEDSLQRIQDINSENVNNADFENYLNGNPNTYDRTSVSPSTRQKSVPQYPNDHKENNDRNHFQEKCSNI